MVLFHTSSAAMKAEKTLQRAGLAVRLVPAPRQYSSDCGFALRFERTDQPQVTALLATAGVETAGVHPLE